MELKIEKLVYGGEGLGHQDGATVFLPYVLPGETVAATPVEKKKKLVRAKLDRVVEPASERVAAPCPQFTVCGGCSYQHIPYEAQLGFKKDILRETLRRLGRIDWTGEITVHASPPWGYRNRAQWKVRQSTGEANPAIGYFRANSMALCPVERCDLLSPLLARAFAALREAVAAGEAPRQLREIEAFADPPDARLLLNLTFAGFPARADEFAARLRAQVPEIESLLFHDPGKDRMELDGPGFLTCVTGGESYRVGHFSFFQVNRHLIDGLVRAVTEGESGKVACDLYAGVGLFALPLGRHFERVVAVEANPAAARDLESNAATARGIEVRTAEAERAIERIKGEIDLIVLDPPRAGLAPGAASRIARPGAERITYVSCEPPTLARDLREMLDAGYELLSLELFDLFPQTFHMETVAKLRRRT